jgi:hypothetical protein
MLCIEKYWNIENILGSCRGDKKEKGQNGKGTFPAIE